MTEEEILESHRGLVKSIIQNQFNPKNDTEFEELEQAGLIGLMKAIRKHDETKARLTTYAYYYILGEIKEFIRQEKYSHIYPQQACIPVSRPYCTITEYMDNLSMEEQTIVEMRLAGHTFEEVGKALGLSASGAHKMYKKLVDRIVLANE